MKRLAFIGLGNPGSQYEKTRHNVGFWAVDAIASRLSFLSSDFQSKFLGQFLKTDFSFTKLDDYLTAPLFLLKPETYMNLSGKSVQSMMTVYKLKPEELCVIHDDLDLAIGKVRIKKAGGAGGHNGLRSIDQTIGQNYWRIRVGIGKPEENEDGFKLPVEKFVLQNPLAEERKILDKLVACLADHFELMVTKGPEHLMNKIALEMNGANKEKK